MQNIYLPDEIYMKLHDALVAAQMAHLSPEQIKFIREEDHVTLEHFGIEADERLCAACIVPEDLRAEDEGG